MRDRVTLLHPTELPDELYPTDTIRVWVPGVPQQTSRSARYLITAAGRVYRDDGLLRPPTNGTIGISGGKSSRSLAGLMMRAFGPRIFNVSRGLRVRLVHTCKRIVNGRSVDWPAELADEKSTADSTDRKRWLAEHRESGAADWKMVTSRRGCPEWWSAIIDPNAPIDSETGQQRASVYDVALVKKADAVKRGMTGEDPTTCCYLVHPSKRKPVPDHIPLAELDYED